MLSFLYVYSDHSILECYNLFSGVELSMRSFFVIIIGDVKARDKGDKASLELPEENTNEKATDINNTTLIKQSDSAVDLDKHEESSTFSSSPQPGPSSRLDKDDELDIDKLFADVSSASVVAADNLPDDGDGQSKKRLTVPSPLHQQKK